MEFYYFKKTDRERERFLKVGHRKIFHPLGMTSKTQSGGEFLKLGGNIPLTEKSKHSFPTNS